MNINMFLMLIVTYTISLIIGKILIPVLHKFKFGQTVREEGPKSHVKKNGTPTMGGIIFILGIVISALLYLKYDLKTMYPVIALVLFSFVGFLDDVLKIKRGKNLGLTAKQKIVLLTLVSFLLSLLGKSLFGTKLYIPFLKEFIDFGMFYVPFMSLVYIGASNAVNLTDGLDGLAGGVTVFVIAFIGVIMQKLGFSSEYPLTIIIIGAILGFLTFNFNPAKVFMGDTGSLGLGGMIVALSIQIASPFVLVLVGVVYIMETLSVIMQVSCFKLTGKRIFKMSPVHHHFEMCGFTENKVLALFVVITIIFGTISIFAV